MACFASFTEEIDRFLAEWLCDPDDAWLKRLENLTAMREREGRAMIAAATGAQPQRP